MEAPEQWVLMSQKKDTADTVWILHELTTWKAGKICCSYPALIYFCVMANFPDSKCPTINWTSIQHESVRLMSNHYRSKGLCYLGYTIPLVIVWVWIWQVIFVEVNCYKCITIQICFSQTNLVCQNTALWEWVHISWPHHRNTWNFSFI